jgi:L-phenylalanine/L-methionine N-acetyltransferase
MLRPATANDFSLFYGLYMHPQINPWLLYEPMEEAAFAPIYAQLLADGCLYVLEQQGRAVGMCKLVPQPHRNSHIVYLGGVGIHPAEAGQGHGLRLMQEVIVWAKERNFWRIELSVAALNTKAIALYQKVGFEIEGTLRQYTWLKKEGRLIDEVMMSYLFTPDAGRVASEAAAG